MRFKLIYPLIAVAVLILSASCKKDEEQGTLRITFRGTFGNDPLVMNETHDYANGQRIQFSKSEFFVSELRLKNGGTEQHVSDIELVDLSFDSLPNATAGITFTYPNIAAGSYDDFLFGFGVSSDLNITTPVDYPSSSPLSSTARYWTPWSSFIFSKTEGKLDTLADGTDNPDLGFAYHTGTDNLYLNINLNPSTPIRITDQGTTTITLYLNHSALMGLPDDALDIKAKPQNHNPGDVQYLQAILSNLTTGALTYTID